MFDKLKDIKIGETEIPTGHSWLKAELTSADVKVTCADELKDVEFNLVEPGMMPNDGYIELKVQNVNINIQAEMKQQVLWVMKNTHTHIKADLQNVGLDIFFKIETQDVQPYSRLAPKIVVPWAKITLDNAKSSIELTGGLLPFTEGVIEKMLKNWLFGFVQKKVVYYLESTLPARLDGDIAKFGTHFIYKNIGYDFSLMEQPLINEKVIQFKFNGTFFKVNGNEWTYAIPEQGFTQTRLMTSDPVTDFEVRVTPASVQSFFDAVNGERLNITDIYYQI